MAKIHFYDVKWFVGKASYNCKMEVYVDTSEILRTASYMVNKAVEALPFVTSVFGIGPAYTWEKDKKVLFSVLCTVNNFPARCRFYRKNLGSTGWIDELIGKGYIVVDLDTFKAEHVELLGTVDDLQQMPR